MRGHTGSLKQRFSKPVVAGSLGLGAAGSLALGVAAGVSTAGSLVLVGLPFILLPGLAMGCHRLLNTPSDQQPLCGLKIEDMRWTCCRQRELSEGCTELCDNEKCGQVWGTGTPCVHISLLDINAQKLQDGYEVFKKEHDLVTYHPDDL